MGWEVDDMKIVSEILGDKTMKMKILVTILLFIVAPHNLIGQPIMQKWWIVDRGGGKSSNGDSIFLRSSIGQPAVQKMSYIDTGTVLESGYIPCLRTLTGAPFYYVPDVGWNLLSVPFMMENYDMSTIYPSAYPIAFCYIGGYLPKTILQNGSGYWLKFKSSSAIPITGISMQQDTVAVDIGWNLIGPPSYPVDISDIIQVGTTVISNYFSYALASGYIVDTILYPGYGYWVRVNQPGTLILKTRSVILTARNHPLELTENEKTVQILPGCRNQDGIGYLSFTDSRGKERVLFFSSIRTDLNLDAYVLPPTPPEGIMDARYSTNRMLEIAEHGKQREIPILLTSVQYPLSIRGKLNNSNGITEIVIDGKPTIMMDDRQIILQKEASRIILRLLPAEMRELPQVFALYQNYPNPFNPTTTIQYELPMNSHVTLKIYNLLGQVVAILTNRIEPAGYKQVIWNASSFASGIYFFRLEARSVANPSKTFTSLKKMCLVR